MRRTRQPARRPHRTPGSGRSRAAGSAGTAGLVAAVLAGCGGGPAGDPVDGAAGGSSTAPSGASSGAGSAAADAQRFPDVRSAQVSCRGTDCTASATVSSPYDSPQRYADAFRVTTTDGRVLGVRDLVHDHAGEQPFTRELTGLTVPADVTTVVVGARDQRNGWGGATVTVPVTR